MVAFCWRAIALGNRVGRGRTFGFLTKLGEKGKGGPSGVLEKFVYF
eukprot:SAG31_NODE_4043_length_3641_cov_26.652739_2_plen_46_part_00